MVDSLFYDNFGPFTVGELLKISGCELLDKDKSRINDLVTNVRPLELANVGEITFFSNHKYMEAFKGSKASYCIVDEKNIKKAPKDMVLLISDNPYKSYGKIANAFFPLNNSKPKEIAKSANISDTAIISKDVTIGENVVIEHGAIINDGCFIDHNSVIKKNVILGKNCYVGCGVVISYAIIGDNVTIHHGVKIGQDGFGFASDLTGHTKVPQLGRVLIGNNVDIGANTCIDRGSGHDTIIEDGCQIDNLVQVAHNVKVGKNSVLVAQVGIAGSSQLGEFVVLGGQSGVAGHLKIGAMVQAAAQSGVISDVKSLEKVGGTPAVPIRQWHRQSIVMKNLIKRKDDE